MKRFVRPAIGAALVLAVLLLTARWFAIAECELAGGSPVFDRKHPIECIQE